MKTTLTLALTLLLHLSCAQNFNYQWGRRMGADNTIGNSSTIGTIILSDANGNVYSAGIFSDTVDFDTGPGLELLTSSSSSDIYIQKLDVAGNYLWTRQIKGPSLKMPVAISATGAGEIWILGTFNGTIDLDPDTGNVSTFTSLGDNDIFLLKLDANGNYLTAKQFGNSLADNAGGLDIDAVGNIYLTGTFRGTFDADPSAGSFPLVSNGLDDIFWMKLNAAGNLIWAKSLGGPSVEIAAEIKVDGAGNVFTTGTTLSTVDLDPGPGTDIVTFPYYGIATFINKLDPAGNQIWTKCFQPHTQVNSCIVSAMYFDDDGNIYTTGYIEFTIDFNPDDVAVNELTSASGSRDIFICKLDSSGGFVWAKVLGSSNIENGNTIQVDHVGNSYISGTYSVSVDFDPDSVSTYYLTPAASLGNFLLKLDSNGDFVWATNLSGIPINGNFSYLDNNMNYYITGQFGGTLDFDPGPATELLASTPGTGSAYVVKINLPLAVGIKDNISNEAVTLSPNPTSGMIALHSDEKLMDATITIFSATGKIIQHDAHVNGHELQFDLRNSAAGIYLLQITIGGKLKTYKIIKE
ncbi:SBBP repeat-containing protein [soil metagenome]